MDSTRPSVGTDSTEVIADRRRPGRMDDPSPELLPLLRQSQLIAAGQTLAAEPELLEPADRPEDLVLKEDDAVAPARGIAFGLMLSVPVWAGIWFALRAWL